MHPFQTSGLLYLQLKIKFIKATKELEMNGVQLQSLQGK